MYLNKYKKHTDTKLLNGSVFLNIYHISAFLRSKQITRSNFKKF